MSAIDRFRLALDNLTDAIRREERAIAAGRAARAIALQAIDDQNRARADMSRALRESTLREDQHDVDVNGCPV